MWLYVTDQGAVLPVGESSCQSRSWALPFSSRFRLFGLLSWRGPLSLWELTIILCSIPWVAKPGCNCWILDFHPGTGQINRDSNLPPRRNLKAKEVTENNPKQCESALLLSSVKLRAWGSSVCSARQCYTYAPFIPWGLMLLSGVVPHKQAFHPDLPGETTDATWKPR